MRLADRQVWNRRRNDDGDVLKWLLGSCLDWPIHQLVVRYPVGLALSIPHYYRIASKPDVNVFSPVSRDYPLSEPTVMALSRSFSRGQSSKGAWMRRLIERAVFRMQSAILGAALLAALTLTAPDSLPQNTQEVPVPDAATALEIAEPALIKTYGKRKIDYERPLTAKLPGGIWIVYGTLCCPDRNGKRTCEVGQCLGGVAILKMRQRDGKILSIEHEK